MYLPIYLLVGDTRILTPEKRKYIRTLPDLLPSTLKEVSFHILIDQPRSNSPRFNQWWNKWKYCGVPSFLLQDSRPIYCPALIFPKTRYQIRVVYLIYGEPCFRFTRSSAADPAEAYLWLVGHAHISLSPTWCDPTIKAGHNLNAQKSRVYRHMRLRGKVRIARRIHRWY